MTKEDRKRELLQEQKEILAQLNKLSGIPDMGSDTEGETFDEETDEAEEYQKNLALSSDLKKRLLEIKEELDKLHK
ncbi:MAG: hypothetical protein HYT03_00075 [Candidatus Harrisonbacteria bacterium]|nr:hypothetical protein [Candidatus Harrisonbacteria bacterium]